MGDFFKQLWIWMLNWWKSAFVNDRDFLNPQLELRELEEKFRKAMIQNAQLDNEKSAIAYQVELYKDKYQDLEAAFSVLQVSVGNRRKIVDYDDSSCHIEKP